MSVAPADGSWLKGNPEESLINYALSIPHYVIKKGRCHGARHGKIEEQKEYQKAWNAWKRCCKKVYVFSDSVLCLGKIHENPQSNTAWEQRLEWFKTTPEYRNLERIDGEPMEFEWNIFPGFTTLQLSHKVQELLSRLSVTPEKFIGRIIFMSMFNDISWRSKDNKRECDSNAQLVSIFAKRFGA